MSEVLDKAVSALSAKMADSDLDSKVRFDIADEGSVLVDGAATPPTVAKGDGDADIVVAADADTFQSLLEGNLDPMAAYMTGKLKIEGDMSLAMKLAKVLA